MINQENSLVVGSGLEKGKWKMITNQYKFFGGKSYKNVLKLDSHEGCIIYEPVKEQ